MGKKLFYITLAVFSVVGIVVWVTAFGVTSGLVKVSESFFSALAEGEYETAYQHLSAEFHDNMSAAELRAFAQESALAGYADVAWGSRSIYGDEGYLEGEVETSTGEYIPVGLTLLKENDSWKIYQIDWESDEPVEETATPDGAASPSDAPSDE
jgi:hypothetical protein